MALLADSGTAKPTMFKVTALPSAPAVPAHAERARLAMSPSAMAALFRIFMEILPSSAQSAPHFSYRLTRDSDTRAPLTSEHPLRPCSPPGRISQ
jgi:hypothetical protein